VDAERRPDDPLLRDRVGVVQPEVVDVDQLPVVRGEQRLAGVRDHHRPVQVEYPVVQPDEQIRHLLGRRVVHRQAVGARLNRRPDSSPLLRFSLTRLQGDSGEAIRRTVHSPPVATGGRSERLS
jgi:hypothetical protein